MQLIARSNHANETRMDNRNCAFFGGAADCAAAFGCAFERSTDRRAIRRTPSYLSHATTSRRPAGYDGSSAIRKSSCQKCLCACGKSKESAVPGAVLLPL